MLKVILDGESLTFDDVIHVARGHRNLNGGHTYPQVEISGAVRENLQAFRTGLEKRMAAGDIIYGVNTGCGVKKGTIIPDAEIDAYQAHYIPAHCVGFGEPFPEEVVRAAMILRVNSFCKGNSGLRLGLLEKILELYNKGVIPFIPKKGSVGASGDLCPLAHMSAVLIGLPGQKAFYHDKLMSAPEALKAAGIDPISLKAKEAMGLTNGSTFMLATTILAAYDAKILLEYSDMAAALSLEAIRGERNAYDKRIHLSRNQPGQIAVAAHVHSLFSGSRRMSHEVQEMDLGEEKVKIIQSGQNKDKKMPRVQDQYSFRCYPQVAGSTYDGLKYVLGVLEREMNASTDNPLVFRCTESEKEGQFEALSGGNFHGEPIAHANDILKIVVQSLPNISNSRFYALTMSKQSHGLPDDLAGPVNNDLNTGLMIAQYSTAAVTSENKVLSHPASVDSIPTSGGQEDYVSMGTHGALFAREVVNNAYFAIAWELIGATQGISLTQEALGNPKLGDGTAKIFEKISEVVKPMAEDHYLHADSEAVLQIMRDGSLLDAVSVVCQLQW
jgi:histidine ammonia-lyase